MGAGASRIAYLANDENVPIEMLIMYVARAARLEYFWAVLLLIDFATTMIKYNQAEDWCDEQEDKEDDGGDEGRPYWLGRLEDVCEGDGA